MNHARTAAALTALALATLPGTALAHSGEHPFENCTAAYKAGYSNIERGDQHYGGHLDRDKDGIGCDQPPADFVPAEEDDGAPAEEPAGDEQEPALAHTGGDSSTPYLAAAGGAVLLAGAGAVVLAARKRRG